MHAVAAVRPAVHAEHSGNARPLRPVVAVHGTPETARRTFPLRDVSVAFQAKIARKQAARDALGYGRGGAGKLDALAVKLGIGRSYVGRCLSLDPRDPEMPEAYLRALGVLDAVLAADPVMRRAA